MRRFYLFENKPTRHDWDSIVFTGFAPSDEDDETDRRYIERVGPFVPPFYSVAQAFIATDSARQQIQNSGLKGISFPYAAEKRKIVRFDPGPDPDWYEDRDDIMEPEDILECGVHDPVLAAEMPNLWVASIPSTLSVVIDRSIERPRFHKGPWHGDLSIVESSWDGSDFMAGREYLGFFVSQAAKDWFERYYPDFACFSEIEAA